MSDPNTIVCPECQTVQRADVPFCDNCGYRLGRPDAESDAPALADAPTQLEQPAVRPEDLKRAAADDSRGNLAATEVEGHPAVTPQQIAAARRQGDRTEVEGLSAIPESQDPTEKHPPIAPASASSDASGLHAPSGPLETEAKNRTVIWAVLWLVSLVAVAMLAVYVTRSDTEVSDEPVELANTSTEPVDVEGGTFERGLSDNVRAFILRTCLKMADDNSECDQDKLLAGEYPAEKVELSAYSIDPLEVTVGRYGRCVEAGECDPIEWKSCKVYTHQGLQVSLRAPKALRDPETALTCVSRGAAEQFCRWRGGRLPTHDEWERAARGRDGRVFPWGAAWDPTAANWGETDVAKVPVVGAIDGFEWAAPPAKFAEGKSPAGAFDMAGNVAEWVAGDEPQGVARGGSWTSNPFELRTTGRQEVDADARRTDIGFRCAYDPG